MAHVEREPFDRRLEYVLRPPPEQAGRAPGLFGKLKMGNGNEYIAEALFSVFCRLCQRLGGRAAVPALLLIGKPRAEMDQPRVLYWPVSAPVRRRLCLLYLIAALGEHCLPGNAPWRDALLIVLMGAAMTATEYIAGILSLRVMKVRLWDYSHNFGNIQGIICPKFSCIWTALGAGYYFLIHPHILGALRWLSDNLAFSFVIGLFFGVFAVDVAHSMQLAAKLKKFAEENDVVVRFENMKAAIRRHQEQTAQKYHFFRPFHSERPLAEQLKNMREAFENRRKKPPKT